MKRKTLVVKHLICALVMFAAVFVQADVVPFDPSYGYSWSHIRAMDSFWLIFCCLLILLFAVLFASLRKERPSYLVWLACSGPVIWFFSWMFGSVVCYDMLLFAFGISVTSWILAFLLFIFKGRWLEGVLSFFGVLIAYVFVFLCCYVVRNCF